MFEIITTAGEGTGRTQPINGLDELLSLPGNKGKGTRSLPPTTGDTVISSFTQMLTEGLLSLTPATGQSLPRDEVGALPLVAEDRPAVGLPAQLTTAGAAQMLQPVVNKAAVGKKGNLPVAGEIDPNIIISLFTAAPFLSGTMPASSEGGDDTLPQSDKPVIKAGLFPSFQLKEGLLELNKLSGEKLIPRLTAANEIEDFQTALQTPPRWVRQPEAGAPPVKSNGLATSLTPAVENRMNQATAPSTPLIVPPEQTTIAGGQAVEPPGSASQGREAVGLAALQTPPRWVRQPEAGAPPVKSNGLATSLTPAVENRMNQATAPSTPLIVPPEQTTIAGGQAVEPPGSASQGREAVGLAALQTPPRWVRQPEAGAPPVKSNGLATSLTPAVENRMNQATAPSTPLIVPPEQTTIAGGQAVEPPGSASQGREAVGLAALQTPPRWVRQPEAGAPPVKSNGLATSLTPAVENRMNQATAPSTPLIVPPEQTTIAGGQAVEPPGSASQGREAVGLAALQTPPRWVRQPEAGAPPVKSNGLATSLTPAVENRMNQATAPSTPLIVPPEQTTIAGGQAVEPPGSASQGREAVGLAALQTPPRWVRQPEAGAPPVKSNGLATSLTPAVENRMNQATAPSTPLIVPPEQTTIAGGQAVEPPGSASQGREAVGLAALQTPPRWVRQPEAGAPPVKSNGLATSLTPAVENRMNQATAPSTPLIVPPEQTTIAGGQAVEPPGSASQGREAVGLAALQTPPRWVRQPEAGAPPVKSNGLATSLTPAVENRMNQATAPSTPLIVPPEQTTIAGGQAVEPPGSASQGREAVGLAALQTPPRWVRQPEAGAPPVKSNGLATSLTPAVENRMNQATAPSTPLIVPPEQTTIAGGQAVEPPGSASQGREAVGLAALQTPPRWVRQPEAGAPPVKSNGLATSLTPAVENRMNQATAPSTPLIVPPEQTTVAGRPAAETPDEASMEREATLPRNIMESPVKTGLGEFLAPKGDAKNSVMDDKGKPHPKEPFAVPEITDINVNTAAPLSKGQDSAVPTGSLLEQVAEQLPQAISKGSGRIRLNLMPDSLGRLDMDLIVRENRVQIVLTAESRTVQQSLQGSAEQLKDALHQQGLEVDGFNVLLQSDRRGQGDTMGGGNPFWGEYNRAATGNKGMGNDAAPATITPFVPGQNLTKGAEGINIFI